MTQKYIPQNLGQFLDMSHKFSFGFLLAKASREMQSVTRFASVNKVICHRRSEIFFTLRPERNIITKGIMYNSKQHS